jgi:AcrR family transcriptional regulator
MARPRSLTLDQVAAAALAVVDRDGLPALSMRSVAAALGIGTMSLYRYVSDREQVERLIVDLILVGMDLSLSSAGLWTERLVVLVQRMRAAIGDHPHVTPLLVAHRHTSTGLFRWGEAVLAVLTEAGFAGEHRVIAFRCLVSYVIGALQYQQLGSLAGPGTAALAALPSDEYPLLGETARDARQITSDEEFRRGLDLVLVGISEDLR